MTLPAVRGLLRSVELAVDALRGRPMHRRAPDRTLLERHILPAYARREDVRRVLFVGCARYTAHYGRLFDHAEYWTMDAVPRNRRWGAPRHIRDRLERLDRHVTPGYFDLIVCNGVLGWGLNRRDDAESAFNAATWRYGAAGNSWSAGTMSIRTTRCRRRHWPRCAATSAARCTGWVDPSSGSRCPTGTSSSSIAKAECGLGRRG